MMFYEVKHLKVPRIRHTGLVMVAGIDEAAPASAFS